MKINVTIDGQSYQVEVVDIHTRPVVAYVDGETFEVWPDADASLAAGSTLTEKPQISVPEPAAVTSTPGLLVQGGSGKNIIAPLPGVIVAVLVKTGDKVSRGQELCTLEAMKMKNAIRANRDTVIESIEINVGDQVSHGQVLMTFAE